MNDWSKDPSLTNSLYLTIIIMGIIAIFALINVAYGFYTKFPTSVEEFLISPVTNWNITQVSLFASAVAIISSINFLKRKLGPWKERVDRKLWDLERGLKPDVYYSFSYEEKMKKKRTESIKNSHLASCVLLIIGFGVGGYGVWLYVDSIEMGRDAFQTWEGINLFKTNSFALDSLSINFIMREPDPPAIHVYYNAYFIQNDSAFLALLLPYNGMLHSLDIENGWNEAAMANNSTLIYKQFSCSVNRTKGNCGISSSFDGGDQDNLLFTIDRQIDAKQFYTHSLNIPLRTAVNSTILEFIKNNVSKTGLAYWDGGWTNVTDKASLTISLQDDATEMNLIPPAYPRSNFFEPLKVNRTVFAWEIPKEQATFHIDYVMPSERAHFDWNRTLSSVLIGIGVSLVSVSIGNFFVRRK